MTALYMAVVADGIVMITDGSAYGKDGAIGCFNTKQMVRPHASFVVSASGTGLSLPLLELLCAEYWPNSFDQLVRFMPDAAMSVQRQSEIEYKGRGGANYDPKSVYSTFLFGGWSDFDQEWQGYIVSTVPGHTGSEPIEPYVPLRIALYAKPPLTREAAEITGLGTDLSKRLEEDGASLFGIKLMFGLRRSRYELHGPGTLEGYGVGGFVEYTFLQRERASTEILYRWPDEIGRVIDADNDPLVTVTRDENGAISISAEQ